MNFVIERTGLEKKFLDACSPVIEQEGLTLYDLEYIKGSTTLRVFIMDEDTKTAVLEDCVRVDRALTPIFEENEWIPEDIVLEVSSPGLFRKVRSDEHLKISLGEWLEVGIVGKVEDSMIVNGDSHGIIGKNKVRGKLESFDDQNLFLEGEVCKVVIAKNRVKKILLAPDI